MSYSIKALKNFYIDSLVAGPVMFFQERLDEKVEVWGYIWLIRGNDKIIVADTGLSVPPRPGEEPSKLFIGI